MPPISIMPSVSPGSWQLHPHGQGDHGRKVPSPAENCVQKIFFLNQTLWHSNKISPTKKTRTWINFITMKSQTKVLIKYQTNFSKISRVLLLILVSQKHPKYWKNSSVLFDKKTKPNQNKKPCSIITSTHLH